MPEKFGYIINRLLTFIDPTKGDKFQSTTALDAIKLGGLKGQGMGEGILKDSVPEAHTDYIIAIISEEYGSIISVMIVLIFLYISLSLNAHQALIRSQKIQCSCSFLYISLISNPHQILKIFIFIRC